jgi:hypothetical protein
MRNTNREWANLALRTENPTLLGRWIEGKKKWGDAFVAFASLHRPELHTTDVLMVFEDHYIASYDDLAALGAAFVESLGWRDPLDRFRRYRGITIELLNWDLNGLVRQFEEYCDLVWVGGRVHAFWK